jgi:hypothetical protein
MYLSVGGTRPGEDPRRFSTSGRTRARAHQLGEPKVTETVENVFGRGLVGMYLSFLDGALGFFAGEFGDRNVIELQLLFEEELLGILELN